MSKIKQLLHLRKAEPKLSLQDLGAIVGMDRGTIRSYFQKITDSGYDINQLLLLDDVALESKFHPGNPAYLEDKFLAFKSLIPYFEKELKRKHVTRRLVWEEYKASHPSGYGYSQFCFHLSQLKVARKESCSIHSHDPAKELYVDYAGDKMAYVGRVSGEVITVEVFVAVLPFSNYTFALGVPSQTTEDFIYALNKCLKYLGESPVILVPDNLKAAVIKTDRYEPTLNKILEDFANHYSMAVIPARPRRPRDKSNAENGVNLIYQRAYTKLRNITFFSLSDLNAALAEKVTHHNQTRMQRYPYSREEKFLADEKSLLKTLPPEDFQIKNYATLTVSANGCIYLDREEHYYSVPYVYIGQRVDLVITRPLVQIYHERKPIATHPRIKGPGYTTQKDHFASPCLYMLNVHTNTLAGIFTSLSPSTQGFQ